ncbi:hypothetical protein F0U62_21755 [Cystobacter fuscus]|uniref:hypothetical protein n=1 Tax=Cystobacter fuscus TaxID=43 RepID=UPI002B2E8B68|nr:hypothetical protein F0U62_21755 [Cystobacter fuscus]
MIAALVVILLILTLVGGLLASRPYWLFVARSDVGVPWGFYRCSPHNEAGVRVRNCIVGTDGFVLHEETHPEGTVHRQWFGGGQRECLRETIAPTGERIAEGENSCG